MWDPHSLRRRPIGVGLSISTQPPCAQGFIDVFEPALVARRIAERLKSRGCGQEIHHRKRAIRNSRAFFCSSVLFQRCGISSRTGSQCVKVPLINGFGQEMNRPVRKEQHWLPIQWKLENASWIGFIYPLFVPKHKTRMRYLLPKRPDGGPFHVWDQRTDMDQQAFPFRTGQAYLPVQLWV